ncbi:preprotein translocase subunit YajC [Candidatus Magnetominusculus xianensis]|uniref:Sec translocon accessory complex subunit YajC n=1 Tax=Candidatus Magnetominusculus xianensis TaxID=1748249 RepID=A0ABR5SF94_9BACT|nr:preprotein translocase subunit YajC [Candidatus Magnetominusculus xianensis]KWT77389.1 preprotein translocase [Candidatus Magnetominusculus xianensis]MBF0405179.1 preprotein translocase subunit YajC [Nitrospirota bacterium]
MFDNLAWAMGAPPPSGQAAGAPDMFMSFFPLIVIFGIFYLLLIRPQQKKAKEHKEMLGNVKKGDKVITTGGIYGLVETVGDTTVVLKIAENVKVKFGKSFIAAVRVNQEED